MARSATRRSAADTASVKENLRPRTSSPSSNDASKNLQRLVKSAPNGRKKAAQEAAELIEPAPIGRSRVAKANKATIEDVNLKQEPETKLSIASSKRKRATKVKEEEDEPAETVHGMSNGIGVQSDDAASEAEDETPKKRPATKPPAKKTKTKSNTPSQSAAKASKDAKDAERAVLQLANVKAKYEKEEAKRLAATTSASKSKRETYGLSEGTDPFPSHPYPTPSDCHTVYHLLHKAHPECKPAPKTVPEPSKFVAGCGEVRSILDALIRTRLSASTTGRNSSAAYQGMVARYGTIKKGVGKGGVDYNAVRKGGVAELFYAIKGGGLAVSKSADIITLLDIVYADNQARRSQLLDARQTEKGGGKKRGKGPKGADIENEEQKDAEIKLAEEENLSLDHFYTLPTYEAIYKFMTFPGIGVKTAACVAMFCMQRPCFAVDTHVFRIAKWLDWVPAERKKGEKVVDRDTTFSHLEVKVPDELKYMLHQLFIKHGKTCPRCRGNTGEGSKGWSRGCVIDHLVTRTGPRKGGEGGEESPVKEKRGGIGGGRRRKGEDSEEEDVEMPDLHDDEEESDEMPELNDDEEPSEEE